MAKALKTTERPSGSGKRLTLSEKLLIRAERQAGETIPAIANKYGVSISTVSVIARDDRLSLYKEEVETLKEEIANKFYIAADAGVDQFLRTVDKASPKDAAISAGILYDKARLADGKSTDNHLHGFLNICNDIPI